MSRVENNNFTINMGTDNSRRVQENAEGKEKRNSIFAGDLNIKNDPIMARKNQLQKQAMKVLMDQFEKDGETDLLIKNAERALETYKEEATIANAGKMEARSAKDAIMKECGMTEDSQEHKDLELMRKVRNGMSGKGSVSLEELEQFSKLGSPTDYQERMLAYDSVEELFQDELDRITKGIQEESSSIRGLKQSILKQHGMNDATVAKEGMLADMAREISGMLFDEAKDKIQEEWDELVEKAKEAAEKKAEEAKLKEHKEQHEVIQENVQNVVEQVSDSKIEMDKMLREAKLLDEDLKGIVVDNQL